MTEWLRFLFSDDDWVLGSPREFVIDEVIW
jgi:hypothetical protein